MSNRYRVTLSPELASQLRRIGERQDRPLSEVICAGLGAYATLKLNATSHETLLIRHPDGSETPVILETLLGPLWAVDFVQDSSGALWAVDFNTTPGVTGIDALLSYRAFGPDGLVGPISEWFARHPLPLPEGT